MWKKYGVKISELANFVDPRTKQAPSAKAFRFAIQLFRTLHRIKDVSYCFVNSETNDRWKDPGAPLHNARMELKMEWVLGWHDFRHFRATQWIMNGVDVEAVRGLLGHKDISTTMKYVYYVAEHAKDSAREAEQRELARLGDSRRRTKQATNRNRTLGSLIRRQASIP
jgi:integrase